MLDFSLGLIDSARFKNVENYIKLYTNENINVVPDIIAINASAGKAIIVEAKPLYSNSDAAKLISLRSGKYEDSIRGHLSLGSQDLILCIAFGRTMDIDFEKQGLDLALTVDEGKQVKIVYDRHKHFG
jgi:hypothetical protein